MRTLRPSLRALLERTAVHPTVLLLLDFDGTLSPYRSRPEDARLSPEERATLKRLNHGRSRLCILTGRSLRDVRSRVGVRGAIYAGNFGLEMIGPGWVFMHPHATARRSEMAAVARKARRMFRDLPGALVEDKGGGLCVHYRNVPPSRRREFWTAFKRLKDETPRGIVWRVGHFSEEATPQAQWNKGLATKLLWRRLGKPFVLAAGNDERDEPMFAAARSVRGESVRVSSGKSGADHRMRTPGELHAFLTRLAERLERAHREHGLRRAPRVSRP